MVISSSFESAYGLAQLAQLAAVIDDLEQAASGSSSQWSHEPAAHGLGTADWFCADLSEDLAKQLTWAQLDVEALAAASRSFVSCCTPPVPVLGPAFGPATEVKSFVHVVASPASSNQVTYDLTVTELAGCGASGAAQHELDSPPVVFLHGFLGAAEDWLPVMAALQAAGRRCMAIDLPAHADSAVSGFGVPHPPDAYSAEAVVAAVAQLLKQLCPVPCDLVGYSLGGRLALLLAARYPHLVARCAVIGASPGLRKGPARAQRAAADDALAAGLLRLGRRDFVEHWYSQPMWASLRGHPCFAAVRARRQRGREDEGVEDRAVAALAAALSGLSVGRQPSLWDDLPRLSAPLLVPPRQPHAFCCCLPPTSDRFQLHEPSPTRRLAISTC